MAGDKPYMISDFDSVRGGEAVPVRGNRLTRGIARALLRLGGWRVAGRLPNLPKMVIVGAPHTSNWDGVWAILFLFAVGIDIHWMGKKEIFTNPFAGFLRWLGGVPVDRQAPTDVVAQVIQEFAERDHFILIIAPEGTRHRVSRWKTGFYRIALGAGVPIVLGFADYDKKAVGVGPVIQPTGDMEEDMAQILAFYSSITARHPVRTSLQQN